MSAAIPPGIMIAPRQPGQGTVWDYAGFWRRTLAICLDTTILWLALTATSALVGMDQPRVTWGDGIDDGQTGAISHVAYTFRYTLGPRFHTRGQGAMLLWIALTLIYFVLLESSPWQGTIGKRVCGMRVTDLHGRRVGLARALGRYLGKYVSWALSLIGFLMVGWTRRKQGLHDMMAGTLVIRRRVADPVFTLHEPPA